MKLSLDNVTLVTVTGVNYQDALFALWASQIGVEFHSSKLIGGPGAPSSGEFFVSERAVDSNLDSIDAYSHYLIYDLWRHIESEYALVVQGDGFILNPRHWTNDFLNFDYVGAPWPLSRSSYIDPFGRSQRVGNGGFSLRSKRLLQLPKSTHVPFDVNKGDFYRHQGAGLFSEDGNICVHNRHIYESGGCRFAPMSLALKFSLETRLPSRLFRGTFGFHKKPPVFHARRLRQLRRVFNDNIEV